MLKFFRRSRGAVETNAPKAAPRQAAATGTRTPQLGDDSAASGAAKGPLNDAERAQLLAREAQAARAARILHQQKRDTAKAVSEAATRAARDIDLFKS